MAVDLIELVVQQSLFIKTYLAQYAGHLQALIAALWVQVLATPGLFVGFAESTAAWAVWMAQGSLALAKSIASSSLAWSRALRIFLDGFIRQIPQMALNVATTICAAVRWLFTEAPILVLSVAKAVAIFFFNELKMIAGHFYYMIKFMLVELPPEVIRVSGVALRWVFVSAVPFVWRHFKMAITSLFTEVIPDMIRSIAGWIANLPSSIQQAFVVLLQVVSDVIKFWWNVDYAGIARSIGDLVSYVFKESINEAANLVNGAISGLKNAVLYVIRIFQSIEWRQLIAAVLTALSTLAKRGVVTLVKILSFPVALFYLVVEAFVKLVRGGAKNE